MTLQGLSVFTNQPIEVTTEGGSILGVEEIAGSGDLPSISPGFLDIQVNGWLDSDYKQEGFKPEDLKKITRCLAESGTSQHLATIVTSPGELVLNNLETIRRLREKGQDVREAIPGIHIEGPYISEKDGARGAHDPAYVRDPDLFEFREWQETAGGAIRILTLAPERKGALEFIRKVADRGVVVAIGHSAADPDTIRQAVKAGARLSTHLGNGSLTMLPRLQNYIWEQLAEDTLRASIISDGFHLPPAVVKIMARAKGLDHLILISDVAHIAGNPPGIYQTGNLSVQVYEDGHLGLPDSPILAGAAHLLDWDIPRFRRYTGSSLAETIRLCTTNPAELLNLPRDFGTLKPGAPANLVLFEEGQERLQIKQTIRAGKPVYTA